MTALSFSIQAPQAAQPIDRLIVFGDSLSDTGFVFRTTNGLYPPNPPYFQGRYSNGRVWVEYLAERLGLAASQIDNFACGGATSGNQTDSLVPGLLKQVQSFTQTNSQLSPTGLYVLWAGANDYLQGATSATAPVQNILDAIRALSDAGAKRLLVANLPNLGELPATSSSASAARLVNLTQTHNQELRRALKQLGQADLEIMTLDANALYQAASTSPAQFGFTNVTTACVSGVRACGNPDQFLFWDGIHPSTAAHRILGQQAFAAIEARLPSLPSAASR
ncbi:MAG: SGNH/GDSL hydrolase family protein [Elainella sp.]